MRVEHVMQTPDGAWRVEIVRTGRQRWYRIIHERDARDWLSIAMVERILRDAGVDMADLVDASAGE